jgi:hypothetical protein
VAYLTSLLVVAGATVVLTVLLVRLIRPARRVARLAEATRDDITERVELLAARAAAVRMEFDRRRDRRRSDAGG